MATNRVYKHGDQLSVVVTNPATPSSGDPVLFGQLPGVALTDEGDGGNASTETTVAFKGVFDLPVRGHDGTSNAAISAGDIVYYDTTNDELDVDTGGVRFGYALEDVASGATTTIKVKVGY